MGRRFRCTIASMLLLSGAAQLVAAEPAAVDGKRMRAAPKDGSNWLSHGRTWDEQRFSPLTQINDKNIGQLGLAWYAELPIDRGVEATPLAIDGVLYNVEPWNVTVAYDGRTGKELWRYDPQVNRDVGGIACCDIDARGVAAWQGKIYVATLDGRLIALDAKTGKPIWSVDTLDKTWPYTITGAPRVFDGKVLIGNGGAELAARGYVTAYDAGSGKQIWRFYTVPGDPTKPQENAALEWAKKTWTGEWWKNGGGGTAWDSIVYDPDLKLVYIGTGNGGPWVQRYRSPQGGDNLFLSSIVALNAETGEYVWHYQETPADQWDYTATQPMILADVTIEGKRRKVIMQAPKNGFFYVLDRVTGKLISAKAYAPMNWATGIDMATGRPIMNPEANYGEVPVIVSPGPGGAHNWNPMAYSPLTGLAYIPANESYFAYSVDPAFKLEPGKRSQMGISTSGYEANRKAATVFGEKNAKAWLSAWDPVAQKERWRVPFPVRGSGGLLVTAGNLVFEGTVNGAFEVFKADTGERIWQMPIYQAPVAAPITYTIDGVQYVAINAGWGGGLSHNTGPQNMNLTLSKPRLLVFKLGGKAPLPAPVKAAALERPTDTTADAATIAKGAKLFAENCSSCHGERAIGGIKDLRKMSPQTHAEFLDIVIGGKRREKGMVSFADRLSQADAEAIHAYLLRRANEDWATIAK